MVIFKQLRQRKFRRHFAHVEGTYLRPLCGGGCLGKGGNWQTDFTGECDCKACIKIEAGRARATFTEIASGI